MSFSVCDSIWLPLLFYFFFFNDTATTEIYTLSLHDALPICVAGRLVPYRRQRKDRCRRNTAHDGPAPRCDQPRRHEDPPGGADRKSTRLNSSHLGISYAVFCLKKKKNIEINTRVNNKQKSD